MLNLPESTVVNLRLTKEKLYSRPEMTPQVKGYIKEQIESIHWRNKLSPYSLSISSGTTVTELHVFEIALRKKMLNKKVLFAISKAINYKILFVLTHQEAAQAWIEAAGALYHTAWLPLEELKLRFEGVTLDSVYENLARQIADGRLDGGDELSEAVEADKQLQKLLRQIKAMEGKVAREKQFNRRVELNRELKRLKQILSTDGTD